MNHQFDYTIYIQFYQTTRVGYLTMNLKVLQAHYIYKETQKAPFQLEPYKWKSQNLIDPFNKNMRNSISKHQTKSRDYKMNEITKYLKL